MMAKVFTALLAVALVFGLLGGEIGQVAAALPQGAAGAVELALSLGGVMCVWSGILEIMDQSGLSRNIAAIRAAAGAADPFSILPAVWLASAASVGAVLLASRLLARAWPA